MKKLLPAVAVLLLASALWAQSPPATPAAANDDSAQLRQEVEQLKKTLTGLEQRLAAQEKAAQDKTAQEKPSPVKSDTVTVPELQADVKDINERLNTAERKTLADRLQWSGDYRFEAHTIRGNVPAHFDGMKLQNMVVKTMFYMNTKGTMPPNVGAIENNVASNYGAYQYFTNSLTFKDLKGAMAQFPPAMQQQLFGMLMPSTFVPKYTDNNDILYTNRLRLKFDSQIADNISFSARVSMYKTWGDSSGVQVFNGQPNSIALDGTTASVPSGDMLRVERAFFSWNNIGGSKFYLSIGRRPSTGGPPMNFRQDEPRGGTPSGSLIDYQFDGITA